MLRLLGRITSSNVRKVLWTARELGIPFEHEVWGLPDRDPNVPEYLALNPNAKVPVIIEDGFVLWESNVIMRYLCHRSGDTRLLPADFRKRALTEQWLDWQGTELSPRWGYAAMALARKVPGYDDEEKIAAAMVKWTEGMAILEAQLARTGAYAAGDDFTLADIALGIAVNRWDSVERDKADFPLCMAYLQTLREREHGPEVLSMQTP